jgi:FK506-binding protein 4/5
MTTDEGTSNNGENPAATMTEQGEDITTKKDRGVLKVRPQKCEAGRSLCGSLWVLYAACLVDGIGLSSKHYSSLPI